MGGICALRTDEASRVVQIGLRMCAYTTYDAVIAWSFVTPSAVDVERVDLATPLDCLLQLPLCFVHVPLASLEKPQQPTQPASTTPSTSGVARGGFGGFKPSPLKNVKKIQKIKL